jgi:large subunit ribosomal protein L10e
LINDKSLKMNNLYSTLLLPKFEEGVLLVPARPAKCYRIPKKRAYTRKEYMRGVPGSKITIFDMGDKMADFPLQVSLVAEEECQIRHNALEAARVSANRYLSKKIAKAGYHLRIRPHPHNVMRENKMMAFAGADRLQDGMRRAFGKPVGFAARVHRDQPLVTISLASAEYFKVAKDALRRAAMKFPTPCKIVIEKGEELVKM